jgi:hypothetical protein
MRKFEPRYASSKSVPPDTPFFSFNINSVGVAIAIIMSLANFGYTYFSTTSTSEHDIRKTIFAVYFDMSKAELQTPQTTHVLSYLNFITRCAKRSKRPYQLAVLQIWPNFG